MFDVCVVGHITKEIIRIDGRIEREMPGGTAYYTSIALRSLGLNVAVVTKMSKGDEDSLLYDLERMGITVICNQGDQTTVFENIYLGEDLDMRVQRVNAISSPFSPGDLGDISAPMFHVGPLTNLEVTPDFLREVSSRGNLVSLDVQGLLRKIHRGEVTEGDWPEKDRGLAHVDILKANEIEATALFGENDVRKAALRLSSLGPREVIITSRSKGSLILANGRFYRIPAFGVTNIVDPTGCGDTFMAGYIYMRMRSPSFDEAGRFGALLASMKLERYGALDEVNWDWDLPEARRMMVCQTGPRLADRVAEQNDYEENSS
jgi:sugar/nucleoside kinase (ribokinase family)